MALAITFIALLLLYWLISKRILYNPLDHQMPLLGVHLSWVCLNMQLTRHSTSLGHQMPLLEGTSEMGTSDHEADLM